MISAYAKIYDLLDRKERVRFFQLVAMMFMMGILDMVGVASIVPFLAVVADPSRVDQNQYLRLVNEAMGFSDPRAFLVFLGLVVFSVMVISLGFKALTLYAMARFSLMRSHSLSGRLLGQYLHQPYVWFLGRNSAGIGKQILSEVQHVVNSAIVPAMRLLAQSISLLFLLGFLVWVEPIVAFAAILLVGGAYFVIFISARRYLLRMGQVRLAANKARFQIAQEAMGGIKEVKIMSLEDSYLARFRSPSREMAISGSGIQVVGELPRHLLEAIAFGGVIAMIVGLLYFGDGDLVDIVPTLGLFALAGLKMFPAVQQVYHCLIQLRSSAPTLDEIHRDLTESRSSAVNVPRSASRLIMEQGFALDDVHYTYPNAGRPALDGLCLSIKARTTVGIVGGTGAGKTTAVDVMLGLLSPQRGRLLVDGCEVTVDKLRAWQNNLGYVPQQIFLTDDTVAGNIAFGVPQDGIDMAMVERAARIANLHEFVSQDLPLGYLTKVGERGVRLSGGQRQRIGIARALYHDPAILILDEATSALDNITERAVIDAVHNLGHEKTIIMIAHRLTTVQGCDCIFLVENGRLAAQGTYDELVAGNAAFRKLVTAHGSDSSE